MEITMRRVLIAAMQAALFGCIPAFAQVGVMGRIDGVRVLYSYQTHRDTDVQSLARSAQNGSWSVLCAFNAVQRDPRSAEKPLSG
jgi:hypothetical protein